MQNDPTAIQFFFIILVLKVQSLLGHGELPVYQTNDHERLGVAPGWRTAQVFLLDPGRFSGAMVVR